MNDFRVHYDMEEDILYLAKEGNEQEVVEISPHSERPASPGVWQATHNYDKILHSMRTGGSRLRMVLLRANQGRFQR